VKACPVCRYCGRELAAEMVPSPPPAPVPTATPIQRKTNPLAIASLVLGIVWVYGIGSVLALVFGYKGKTEIDNSNGLQGGRGLAVAGIVLGWIGVAVIVLGLIIIVAVSFMGSAASNQFSSVGSAVNGP
jgi:hypothetical protein